MNLIQILSENKIKFPPHWKEDVVVEVLSTFDSTELPEYFGLSISGCTKLLAACVPDKPSKQPYSKYFRELLDPKLQKAPEIDPTATYSNYALYNMGFSAMAIINKFTPERRADWDAYKQEKDHHPQE